MLYNSRAPLSAYVDRGSVQIGETLRNRYAQNFQAADELQSQLDLLNSTEFEGDLTLRNALEKNTRERLDKLADRGDYENLSLAVNKTNRDFQSQYSPIKKNYDLYQQYVADVKKKYEDGFIDAETAQAAVNMSIATNDYKGLQLDPAGNVAQDSYFAGASLVKDVNITELVNEGIKGMMPDKDVTDITQVKGGMLVRTKTGTEFVDANRVMSIYNEVINRPDVSAALNQKSRVRTYNLTDEQKTSRIAQDIQDTEKTIQDLQKEVNTDKYSPQQKTALFSRINQLQSEVNEARAIDATTIDGYIRNREVQKILDPVEQSVLAKNVYSQVEEVYEEDFNKVYMAQLQSDLTEQRAIRTEERKNTVDAGMITTAGDSLQFAAPYDFEEYASSLDNTYQQIQDYDAIINDASNSPETKDKARAAKLRLENNQSMQVGALAAIAKEVMAENPELIASSTNFNNPAFYETLSENAREAINDKLQDEKGNFHYLRPQESTYMTQGSKQFGLLEKALKQSMPTLPASLSGYVVNYDGDDKSAGIADVGAAPTQNFAQAGYAGAKIDDVAVTTGGVAGTASEGEYIVFTLSGESADGNEVGGKRVLVPMDQIQSSTLNAFKNTPHYTLTKRMNQARMGKVGEATLNASMKVMRQKDDKTYEVTVPVEVYMNPDAGVAGDQVRLRYQGADGSIVTTNNMSIEELVNNKEVGLGSEHILSFEM